MNVAELHSFKGCTVTIFLSCVKKQKRRRTTGLFATSSVETG